MNTRLAIPLVHLVVSAILWAIALVDWNPPSFYATVLFFLWNIPSVWVLKGLGLSETMDTIGFVYGGPIMVATMQLLLVLALFAISRARRLRGA
jgi:hypothetical protein